MKSSSTLFLSPISYLDFWGILSLCIWLSHEGGQIFRALRQTEEESEQSKTVNKYN